ncbi:LysR family transcriptional regulator [Staphylococcus warneri]|uniref:LysR family transcriptional regulator n=1 Tax=Staphylococcus warneri TaxID=1292 RepID=UPI003260B13C
MEIRHLHYFVTIAEAGSITKAAEALHISQPPLSRQLKSLETELGFKLFNRENKKGINLTKQGEFFLDKAKGILNNIDNALTESREFDNQVQQRISIGTTIYTSMSMFQHIEAFKKVYQETNFNIWESDSKRLIHLLNQRQIDVAYVNETIDDATIKSEVIKEDECVCVLPYNIHENITSETLSINELAQLPLILLNSNNETGFYKQIMDTFKMNQLEPNIFCECHDSSTLLQFLARGFGGTILPTSFLTSDIFNNHVVLPIVNQPWSITIKLAWKKEDFMTKKVKAYIENIVKDKK